MASKLEVYAPCPCGSGKKVKFCCNTALLELDPVVALHEQGQDAQALQRLSEIGQRFPKAPIVSLTAAQLLIEVGHYSQAMNVLESFQAAFPDNATGTSLFALARLMEEGFEASRAEVQRAFQVGHTTCPDLLSTIAVTIAREVRRTNPMSGREHLALALRLSSDEEMQMTLFRNLMEIDGDQSTPYPLRGPHSLEPVEGTDEVRRDLKNAARLAALGCWQIAGRLFLRVSEQLPDDWALWKNIGLCRAWDAERDPAAEALHKAAELAPTFEDAVECETLAQLLELDSVEEMIPSRAARLNVGSGAVVLSRLDDCDHLFRQPDSPEREGLVEYLILSHPVPDAESLSNETAPFIIGKASFVAGADDDEQGGTLLVSSFGDSLDENLQTIRDLLGDECLGESPVIPNVPDEELRAVIAEVPIDLKSEFEVHFYGTDVPVVRKRELTRQHARENVLHQWVNMPLQRLGGKTPKEAAADESTQVAALAAVHVLLSINTRAATYVDEAELQQALGLPAEAALPVSEDLSPTALSIMQSHRLPVDALSDEQIAHVVSRALLIRHGPFSLKVLNEVVQRDLNDVPGVSREQILHALATVNRERGHLQEAIDWTRRGREDADKDGNFEKRLTWTMREFEIRLENPQDPEIQPLVDRLWNFFGTKLPQLRDHVAEMLQVVGLAPPGETAAGLVLPTESVGAGAGAADSATGGSGESRLWLPD